MLFQDQQLSFYHIPLFVYLLYNTFLHSLLFYFFFYFYFYFYLFHLLSLFLFFFFLFLFFFFYKFYFFFFFFSFFPPPPSFFFQPSTLLSSVSSALVPLATHHSVPLSSHPLGRSTTLHKFLNSLLRSLA